MHSNASPHSNTVFLYSCIFTKNIDITTAELKSSLINKISKVEDPAFFELLKVFVESQLENNIYKLSEPERLAVEEGMKQLERGKGISEEEIDRKVQKWLDEK